MRAEALEGADKRMAIFLGELFNCLRRARRAIERWHQGSLMCILGGSPRESRREKKEKKKKKNKGRRRQSRKTEAACVARFAVTTYWPYTKLAPPPAK